jgi:hypothetical protein
MAHGRLMPMTRHVAHLAGGWRRGLGRLLIAVSVVSAAQPSPAAEEPGIRATRVISRAFVNPDASLGITGDFVLQVPRAAPPVALLRFSLPHGRFHLRQVRASLNGAELKDIRLPLDGQPGFEVWLGGQPMAAGRRAALHVEYTLLDEVTAEQERDNSASIRWSPPSIDGLSMAGADVSMTLVLLPGSADGEVDRQPSAGAHFGELIGRPAVIWHWPRGLPPEVTSVGASFPRRGMSRLAERGWWSVAAGGLETRPWARAILAAMTVALFGAAYFGFTRGRHVAAFLVVGATLGALVLRSPHIQLLLLPVLVAAAGAVLWRRWHHRDEHMPEPKQMTHIAVPKTSNDDANAEDDDTAIDPATDDDDAEEDAAEDHDAEDDDADEDDDVEIDIDTSPDERLTKSSDSRPWRDE